MTEESGTEVDADVFEELLHSGNLTVRVTTEKSTGETCHWVFSFCVYIFQKLFTVVLQHELSSLESSMSDNSSDSQDSLQTSDSSDATVIVQTNGGTRTHAGNRQKR